MSLYPLFLVVAAATVLSPGPGVVMTLSNALRFGLRGTFGGILGIACGALVVAAVSATSLGVVLAASATAYTVVKLLGAAYLAYLGWRLWRAPPLSLDERGAHEAGVLRRFAEGLALQFTNPKAIFFFLSVFPQFIDRDDAYLPQFALLVLTYGALVVLIHCGYALMARRAKHWFASESGGRAINRAGGATFVAFGVAMAASRN